jgi:hypothetical protein
MESVETPQSLSLSVRPLSSLTVYSPPEMSTLLLGNSQDLV